MTTTSLHYPDADRDDTADVLHGIAVPDPYRYLEDPDADRTREFVRKQNELSAPYLAALPARGPFLELITDLLTRARSGVPWERGGRYFRMDNPGELDQDQLLVAESLDELLAGGRILLDPNLLAADGTIALTAAEVSPDGRLVACALSEAGSDWLTITVRDVGSGIDLPDRLEWAKWVAPTWMPDATGFLYWRYPPPEGSGTSEFTDAMGAGELVLHRVGEPQAADTVVWSRPEDQEWMASPLVSADGRWLALTSAPGTDSRAVVEVRRIAPDEGGRATPDGESIAVVDDLTDAQVVVAIDGDLLYLLTETGAERGRLVVVDLADPALPWRELVPEHPQDVLAGADAAASGLVLTWLHDAAHRVQIVDRTGIHRDEVEVGGPSAVFAVHARATTDEVFIGSTSFTRRLQVDRLDVGTVLDVGTGVDVGTVLEMGTVTVAQQRISVTSDDLAEVVADRRSARSADGTAVPMTVVRRADLPDGPHPTLLYGYGGFNIPVLPNFSAMFTAWIELGGVLAVANLRGGGEYGAPWHHGGMKAAKQNVFDDLYGCAETLITDGTTTREQLAVHGRSNGGLLVGAAITQRPDLWAAALPTVGVLDMLRFHLFTIGWAWTSDYGSPDEAAEFTVLHEYSPLHRLVAGTAYPPTLICTGDHDDRVVPAHSLKFGAQLQFCQSGDAPVLLRVDTRAGHGVGKPARALAAEYADQLAFAAEHTGMVVGR